MKSPFKKALDKKGKENKGEWKAHRSPSGMIVKRYKKD